MTDFPFDVVGFDLDGTLLDTLGDLAAAVNHVLVLDGRTPVAEDEVRGMTGAGVRVMLEKALSATGEPVSPERFEELHSALLDYYEANIAIETKLFPGGEAMLDALALRGVKLAVVTNKIERFAKAILQELGLAGRFFTIIGGDTLGQGRAKPEPDLLHLMMERAGGGRTAYVGDTSYDTRAAAAAGLPSVVVSFGFNDRPVQELGAGAVIGHYDELLPALERLGAIA